MSRFTVVWTQEALDGLADIWLRAADRSAITLATSEIDRRLGSDPTRVGESLAEGLRRFMQPPLNVFFTVREQDRIVEIAMVGMASGPAES